MRIALLLIGSLLLCTGIALAQDNMEKATIEKTFQVRGEMTLSLRIDGGEVELLRNEDDDCQVLVEHNKEKCRAEVNFDEKTRELEIYVDHDNWSMTKSGNANNSNYAKVRVKLPHRPDLSIDAVVKAGKLDFTLGDLHLVNLEVKSWAGEARVDFDKPNRCDMKTMDFDFKVGEVKLLNLGNARFEEADINSNIGEMTLDFNGEHVDRAMVRIDLEIGETTIIVPDDIGVKARVSKFLFLSNVQYPNWFEQEGSYYYSRNYKDEKKSLYLVISTGIGELNLRVDKSDE